MPYTKGTETETPMIATTTYHTYADLLTDGGRHAATEWTTTDMAAAVAATLRLDPDAIILRVVCGTVTVRGLAPAGVALVA
jgi:hypothetical protein